jgi:hypothetical protein
MADKFVSKKKILFKKVLPLANGVVNKKLRFFRKNLSFLMSTRRFWLFRKNPNYEYFENYYPELFYIKKPRFHYKAKGFVLNGESFYFNSPSKSFTFSRIFKNAFVNRDVAFDQGLSLMTRPYSFPISYLFPLSSIKNFYRIDKIKQKEERERLKQELKKEKSDLKEIKIANRKLKKLEEKLKLKLEPSKEANLIKISRKLKIKVKNLSLRIKIRKLRKSIPTAKEKARSFFMTQVNTSLKKSQRLQLFESAKCLVPNYLPNLRFFQRKRLFVPFRRQLKKHSSRFHSWAPNIKFISERMFLGEVYQKFMKKLLISHVLTLSDFSISDRVRQKFFIYLAREVCRNVHTFFNQIR